MDTPLNQNIALLIDADNSPAAKIDFIVSELATYGVVNIRKAYGNWNKRALKGWVDILHEYAIQPIQHFDLVKGKNATDMALLIDAMDILYMKKDVQIFCLVSSDCDFTPLSMRLREDGKQVFGFGGKNTPGPFISSCTKFFYLEEASNGKAEALVKADSVAQLKQNTKLMNILRSAVKAAEDDDGWARLGPVGSYITNQGPFDHRSYGFKKLSDLFKAIDLFQVRENKTTSQIVMEVKLLKGGPKKKTAKKKAAIK